MDFDGQMVNPSLMILYLYLYLYLYNMSVSVSAPSHIKAAYIIINSKDISPDENVNITLSQVLFWYTQMFVPF